MKVDCAPLAEKMCQAKDELVDLLSRYPNVSFCNASKLRCDIAEKRKELLLLVKSGNEFFRNKAIHTCPGVDLLAVTILRTEMEFFLDPQDPDSAHRCSCITDFLADRLLI